MVLTPSPTTAVARPPAAPKPNTSSTIDPDLTLADRLVLHNLIRGAGSSTISPDDSSQDDQRTLNDLLDLTDPINERFQPIVFTTWDVSDFPAWPRTYLLQPYIAWASGVVRNRSDVVFLTNILLLSTIGLPNFVLLFRHFTWYRAIFQWAVITYSGGPYSSMMHNYVHGPGVLSKRWWLLDTLFPYILGPMMGQTWNSFYYHHKHHHVEDNGPDDLSSTLRYQRDSAFDLALYLGRFTLFMSFELPLYYIRKGIPQFAVKFFTWEMLSFAFIALMARINLAASMTALVFPFLQWRIAIMTNNGAQHVFIDEEEPASSLRCSITLIEVTENRHLFNDGYHTSHHLLPARHWREHPHAFLKAKHRFGNERALTFQRLNLFKLTYLLLKKDYKQVAECLVPMGEQVGKTTEQIATMLQKKTQRFSDESIRLKYR